ncbi:MAG: phosphoglycerate kinase [Alphaproteobacteria bacterium]|nr:phosphoglycerate kinase [Alphaproteobacteria bacterium]|tara:strand:- start:45146 stop:46348 length:1203 start_codon:yes stop_codon:yes gene_type:complete
MSDQNFKTLRDYDLTGKRVLLRADLNVPRHERKVTDTTRIDRLKGTIDYLCEKGARVLILSHFGRPEGEQNPEMSLAFMLNILEERWNTHVRFYTGDIGENAEDFSHSVEPGEVALIENIRFHKGEKKNDPDFAKALASMGDIFVNDAFSAAHRAHASTEGIAHHLPSAAGLLMEEELSALNSALGTPKKPVAAIAGGSKISTKLGVLNNLVEKVDYLILGGGMANTFLFAQGADVGGSLCEKDMVDEALTIIEKAKQSGCEILLPEEMVTVTELSLNAPNENTPSTAIPSDRMAVDISAKSCEQILEKIKDCKTIVWNGPLGVFEIRPFDNGTNMLAQTVAERTQKGEYISIAGGGDTVSALDNAGALNDFSYISTAGGAFLEWMEGKTLPGVAALMKD